MQRESSHQSRGPSAIRAINLVAVAACAALLLGACSSSKKVAEAPPAPETQQASSTPAQGSLFSGPPQGGPRFAAPAAAAKVTPDLNSVPTVAPTPRSSQAERDKAMDGLTADRTNARYSEQGGRTMPVAVRPLIDSPEAVRAEAVARIDQAPPPRPEVQEPSFESQPVPQIGDVGPRGRGAVRSDNQVATLGTGNLNGFRPLADFQQATYSRSTLAGTMAMIGGNLTPNDRNVLNITARQQIDSRGKAVIRVVGHGTGGVERAVIAAGELQRLGVAKSNIFVGVDNVAGPTEVFFDRAK